MPTEPLLHVMSYGADGVEEASPATVEEARAWRGRRAVTWLNVDAAHHEGVLAGLASQFGAHPLTVEDVRNTHQRPKVERYPGYVFVVTHMVSRDADGGVATEQLSLLLGDDWLVTVQETPGDVFEPVRARIRSAGTTLRSAGPDYLLYALLDAIVDSYFPILEGLGADADALEERILAGARDARGELHSLRRSLLTLRRVAWPQRDALDELAEEDTPFVRRETRTFLRDVQDHATRVLDLVEAHRELASSLVEMHLAEVAQRTNEVTKLLTIVATIFIPLTFIVGVYGMNFHTDASPWSMPELSHPYGYPAVMAFMALLGLGMVVAFKRRGWF